MIKWLSSAGSLVIQIILVVAAVLVFGFIDPFNIFQSTKLRLKDTPAQVRKIKEIGELVTAEYFGEVISSYQNLVESIQDTEIMMITSEIEKLDTAFIRRVSQINNIQDQRSQKQQFDLLKEEYKKSELSDKYLSAIEKAVGANLFSPFFNRLFKKGGLDLLLNDKAKSYLQPFTDKEKTVICKKYQKRKFKKTQLILVGRGRVQAGYRFQELDQNNIFVDSSRKCILIWGMKAEILSCDINPWFIPELGIKGFEILEVNHGANNARILYLVKKNCLDSLRHNAIASGILEMAKINAEQNLKQFFSLLLDDSTYTVRIIDNELDYYIEKTSRESYIGLSDLQTIEEFTSRYLASGKDSDRVFTLIDSLKLSKLVANNDTFGITPYTSFMYNIIKQPNLTDNQRDSIKNIVFGDTKTDLKWFYRYDEKSGSWVRMDKRAIDSLRPVNVEKANNFYFRQYLKIKPN